MRSAIAAAVLLLGACILAVTLTGMATPSPEDPPETAMIGSLAKIYEPVNFSHGMHTLVADDCATCHHHSEPDQTPACKECHGAPFDPKNLNMPGLKGAYHLQCMGCHKDIGGPRGCTECHAKKK